MAGRFFARVMFLFMVLGLVFPQANAQDLPSISPDQLQQLQQQQQGRGPITEQPSVTQQTTVLEPTAPTNPNLPTSKLETILSQRARVTLTQFGYDQLGVGRSVTQSLVGAVQDDYVLGPGDEIAVSLRGQENAEYRVTVDRDGLIVLPRMGPVTAGGRTFGEFRADLVNAIHRAYVATEGYISIGRLRQISILVSGEVNSPGIRTLTGLSTAVDAILVSGGVKKTGSLRNVYILRGTHRIAVDLYSVLTGHAQDSLVALADGDRVVVPPLGPTVAVTGWVRRPGIYEMAPGRRAMSVHDVLSLAGGVEVRGKYDLSLLSVGADGRSQLVNQNGENGAVEDSDILFVQPAADQTVDRATLSGSTNLAGQYSIRNTKLSELLKAPGAVGTNPYTLFGIISRQDPVTRLRRLIAFTPVAVLTGTEDMDLQSDDIVRIVSASEAHNLFAAVQETNRDERISEEALRNPQTVARPTETAINAKESGAAVAVAQAAETVAPPAAEAATPPAAEAIGPQAAKQALPSLQLQGTQQLDQANIPSAGASLLGSPQIPGSAQTSSATIIGALAGELNVDPLVLANFLRDHSVAVDGAVNGPGLYLVGPDAEVGSLLKAAGGLQRWADKSAIEVITTTVDPDSGSANTDRRSLSMVNDADAHFIVSPHDDIRVNEVYTDVGVGSVTVQGEVRHVGIYQIVRGEHLSDLLIRAGGLTQSAFPYGTVFLRRSEAEREQEAFHREAQEVEDQLLLALSRRDPNAKLDPGAYTALQGYVEQLKTQKGLGRVTVVADPAVLAANPSLDPLLEAGDVIYVPQRPFAVSVLGEVLQPGSIPFNPGMTPSDYIRQAGGYSQFADKSTRILVLPDGTARRLEDSWFDFGGNEVPPGSTIYVARDISGLDLHQLIIDTTQIFSQFATSAAALAVLSKE